jgi:hypothetical protein
MYPTHNLLQTIKIPYYADLKCKTLGLDSLDHCFDKNHYTNYPHEIDYTFNEIGYRCRSVDQYRGNEILAIGDSFTLGLGVNQKDCWSSQLEYLLDYPVLNFSLNGASNDWIARKIKDLLTIFKPKCIIVHYSFSHRREKARADWHDNERTESDPAYSGEENLTNWQNVVSHFSVDVFKLLFEFIPSRDIETVLKKDNYKLFYCVFEKALNQAGRWNNLIMLNKIMEQFPLLRVEMVTSRQCVSAGIQARNSVAVRTLLQQDKTIFYAVVQQLFENNKKDELFLLIGLIISDKKYFSSLDYKNPVQLKPEHRNEFISLCKKFKRPREDNLQSEAKLSCLSN